MLMLVLNVAPLPVYAGGRRRMENVDIIDISPQIDAIIQAPYRCRVPTPLVLSSVSR